MIHLALWLLSACVVGIFAWIGLCLSLWIAVKTLQLCAEAFAWFVRIGYWRKFSFLTIGALLVFAVIEHNQRGGSPSAAAQFDPDSFMKSRQSGFDPDSFMASRTTTGRWKISDIAGCENGEMRKDADGKDVIWCPDFLKPGPDGTLTDAQIRLYDEQQANHRPHSKFGGIPVNQPTSAASNPRP